MISIQLGELGEELAREKPAQSKVEMLEAQVRIMQEKLSKVGNIDTMQFNKTFHIAATQSNSMPWVLDVRKYNYASKSVESVFVSPP